MTSLYTVVDSVQHNDCHMRRLQKAELGYLLRAANLDSNQLLDDPSATSVRSLAERHRQVPFDDLIRGDASFGAFLEEFGFNAVPSPSSRSPGPGNPYYNGGYLTRRHGSKNGGSIDAIQIESARSFREPAVRHQYAAAVAKAIRQYVCRYYVSAQQDVASISRDDIAASCRPLSSGQHRTFSSCVGCAASAVAAYLYVLFRAHSVSL